MEQECSAIDQRGLMSRNQFSLQTPVCSLVDELTIVDENAKKGLEGRIQELKIRLDRLQVDINTQSDEEKALRNRLADIDTEKVDLALSG
jgi:hypothetical protein